jgi:hypothetical protein
MINVNAIENFIAWAIVIFIFLSSALVLLAIPVGWVVLIVRAIKRLIKKKGAEKQEVSPPATGIMENGKRLIKGPWWQ